MRTSIPFFLITIALLSLLVSACAPFRQPMRPGAAPDTVTVRAILRNLQAQAGALQSFDARRVTVLVQAPGLEARQQLPGSTVYYEKPGNLHVIGRKLAGKTYARIYVSRNAFLLDLPVDDAFFYRRAGEAFTPDSPEAAPGDVVEELFAPVDWASLDAEAVELVDEDTPGGETDATLKIPVDGDRSQYRIMRVSFLEDRWVMAGGTLYANDEALVQTAYAKYQDQDGFLFPMEMEIQFPKEGAFLKFNIGNVTLNAEIDPALFDVDAQAEALRLQGYEEREPYNHP